MVYSTMLMIIRFKRSPDPENFKSHIFHGKKLENLSFYFFILDRIVGFEPKLEEVLTYQVKKFMRKMSFKGHEVKVICHKVQLGYKL